MRRRATSFSLLAVFALMLAACSSTKDADNPNLVPTDYRREIVATLRKLFESNDTVRVSGAFVSEPALAAVGKEQRYTACVRYTAHGLSPGEIGNAVRIAYFFGGHLNQLIAAEPGQCDTAAYKPFPELEKVCVGTGCKK
jgi:hypothetical protein